MTSCGKVSKAAGAPAGQVLLKKGWSSLRVAPASPEQVKWRGDARGDNLFRISKLFYLTMIFG